MYPASAWSAFVLRAIMDISACDLVTGHTSSGSFGSPVFACAGKTDRPSSSHRSRRPRPDWPWVGSSFADRHNHPSGLLVDRSRSILPAAFSQVPCDRARRQPVIFVPPGYERTTCAMRVVIATARGVVAARWGHNGAAL